MAIHETEDLDTLELQDREDLETEESLPLAEEEAAVHEELVEEEEIAKEIDKVVAPVDVAAEDEDDADDIDAPIKAKPAVSEELIKRPLNILTDLDDEGLL
ncbi:MAG TPA: hypothetical protein VLA04_02380 [Verrucomicrobiae bacterium]|nr:hypothetical protein [Verrucomicrobiae bacterium]